MHASLPLSSEPILLYSAVLGSDSANHIYALPSVLPTRLCKSEHYREMGGQEEEGICAFLSPVGFLLL